MRSNTAHHFFFIFKSVKILRSYINISTSYGRSNDLKSLLGLLLVSFICLHRSCLDWLTGFKSCSFSSRDTIIKKSGVSYVRWTGSSPWTQYFSNKILRQLYLFRKNKLRKSAFFKIFANFLVCVRQGSLNRNATRTRDSLLLNAFMIHFSTFAGNELFETAKLLFEAKDRNKKSWHSLDIVRAQWNFRKY